jgi:hypothetical protein
VATLLLVKLKLNVPDLDQYTLSKKRKEGEGYENKLAVNSDERWSVLSLPKYTSKCEKKTF